MIDLCAILAMAVLDRWRGDTDNIGSRLLEKLLYGAAAHVAVYGVELTPLLPLFMLAMLAGSSTGWGEPLGALLDRRPMSPDKFEWWQRWVLPDLLCRNAVAAMIVRGLIWAAPFLPLALIDADLLAVPLAFAIAVPVAPYLFRDWEIQEFARGGLAGLIIVSMT